MASFVLRLGPDVQQRDAAVPGQVRYFFQVELLHHALGEVFHQEARHVHRVLGGGVGGRVGQVQVLELDGGQPGVDGRGQHVDPLIHALVAHDLGP